VIVANDFVTRETMNLGKRIADNRRAQVPDVHALGDIRPAVIDHDRPGFREARNAQTHVCCSRL
jgi:hypothetical protein